MKRYESQTKTVVNRVLVERKCDLCGCVAKTNDWDAASFRVQETEISVTIKQRDGSAYPECGSGNEYEVDLCPKCFKDRLIPWLQSQGADIEQGEWDC